MTDLLRKLLDDVTDVQRDTTWSVATVVSGLANLAICMILGESGTTFLADYAWLAVLVVYAAGTVLHGWGALRCWKYYDTPGCAVCGYELTALPSSRCPECGTDSRDRAPLVGKQVNPLARVARVAGGFLQFLPVITSIVWTVSL